MDRLIGTALTAALACASAASGAAPLCTVQDGDAAIVMAKCAADSADVAAAAVDSQKKALDELRAYLLNKGGHADMAKSHGTLAEFAKGPDKNLEDLKAAAKEAGQLAIQIASETPPKPLNDIARLATAARTALESKVTAEQNLNTALRALADSEGQGTAAQMQAVANYKTAKDTLDKAEKAVNSNKEDVSNAVAALDESDDLHVKLLATAKKAVTLREQVMKEANRVIALVEESRWNDVAVDPKPDPAPRVAAKEKFLKYIESNPLVASYVTGSGIQVSSSAGDGKLTMKGSFSRFHGTDWHISASLSAPLNSNDDDGLHTLKNDVTLDRLSHAVSGRGEFFKINQFGDDNFWLAGGALDLAQQKLSHYDPATSFADPAKPAAIKQNYLAPTVSVFGGIGLTGDDFLLARLSWQKLRKQGDPVTMCPVVPGATLLECVSGRNAPAPLVSHKVLSLSYRGLLGDGKFPLTPTVSYDLDSHVRAVEIPIYFSIFNRGWGTFSSAKPDFTAGLSIGWRSDSHMTYGVFAGVPFSLLPQ